MPGNPRQAISNATGILLVVAALLTVGLVMVASAGVQLDRPVITWRFWESRFGRQAIFTVLGFLTMLLAGQGLHGRLAWRPGRFWQPSVFLYGVTALCLAAALVPGIGTARKGAQRWLQVGPAELGLSFQPSELAKVALVVLLAAMLSGRSQHVRSFWRGLLPAGFVIALCVGLVGVEDFGTAALLAAAGGVMLIAGGVRWSQLALVAIPGIAAMSYLVISEPYRLERLTTFLDIWKEPRGAGYHPIQSLITIASGGVFGRGLGEGVQKYGYLPEARNDFIFAMLNEEVGLTGALVVILLFLALIWLGWRAVDSATTHFGRLLALGVTFLLGFQAAINIAVVTVCAPTKGISLPFVSAGGSGVVILGLAAGMLVSVAREPELDPSPRWAPDGQGLLGLAT